jgi:hypothetical protein
MGFRAMGYNARNDEIRDNVTPNASFVLMHF